MAAATSKDDNDDDHPPSSTQTTTDLDEFTKFCQEWDTFYSKFVQSNKHCYNDYATFPIDDDDDDDDNGIAPPQLPIATTAAMPIPVTDTCSLPSEPSMTSKMT